MKKKSKSKSLSRYLAVQATYNKSFGFKKEKVAEDFLSKLDLKFHIDFECELKKSQVNKNFFKKIFFNVYDKEDYIVSLINENLESSWSLSRLPKILQAILEVAISEMLAYPKTSVGIIVTEYIGLAESFNIEKENSFINAILDKIHKKLNQNG